MPHLIPISELPRETEGLIADMPEPRVVWGVDLPSNVDQDRLLLDAGHLRRIQKLSGSAMTAVSLDPDAKGEEYDTTIAGFSDFNTALMGRTKKLSPADPSVNKVTYEFDSPNVHGNYGAFAEAHLLNKNAMLDEVQALKAKRSILSSPMTTEDAWGRVLDDHLQASLRKSAKDVLLRSEEKSHFSRNWEYGWLAMVASFIALDAQTGDATALAVQVGIFAGNYGLRIGLDTLTNKQYTGNSLIEKKRWSLFTQSQTDRYVALNALTRVNSIIKVRK